MTKTKPPPTNPASCQFSVGDRVEEIEQLGLAKVIMVQPPTTKDALCWYQLREFAHPHRIRWADEYHVSQPSEMRHDPRNNPKG